VAQGEGPEFKPQYCKKKGDECRRDTKLSRNEEQKILDLEGSISRI
jgi:hypothetical protein